MMSVLFALLPAIANAQILKAWGLKAGVTSSAEALEWASASSSHLSERRVGFIVGGFAEWSIFAPVSLLSEA